MSSDLMQQLVAMAALSDDPGKKPPREEPRVLLVTTVDVGGGASERIEVRVGESPEDVARAFCLRHNLPEAIVGPLAAHLDENLRKAATNRGAADNGKHVEGAATQPSADGSTATLEQPQRTKSPRLPPSGHQVVTVEAVPQSGTGAGSGGAGGGTAGSNSVLANNAKHPQYSFGSGMDERLYQQLSSKLLDESHAPSTRRGNWVSASEVLSGGNGGSGLNSKRSSTGLSTNPAGPYQYGKNNPSTGPSPRDRDSVHMRLYATAQERAARLEERRRLATAEAQAALTQRRSTISWLSAELMRGRGANGAYENYGEMLYAEGVEALMSRLKRAEAERKAREARELEGVTFAPMITKKAMELKQRERNSLSAIGQAGLDGGDVEYEKWQRLHARGMRKSTLERLEQLRLQREAAEVAECTFRPRINKNSDALMAEALKSNTSAHYELLFKDAARRQDKMNDLQHWYPDGVTFKPQVNKDPRAMEYLRRSWDRFKQQAVGVGGGSGTSPSPEAAQLMSTASTSTQASGAPQMPPVVARLYAEAERKQAKLEAARQAFYGPIDPVTKKPLFQPDIGRGPRGGLGHARNSRRGGHIGEHLYRTAQELAAKRAAAEEADRRATEEEASRSRTTAMSQRLFTDLKLKRFRQIFEYLDEEGCGELDLLAALGRSPPGYDPDAEPTRQARVDNLDSEVLLDVEAAADVWARANGLMLTHEEQRLSGKNTATGSPTGQSSCYDGTAPSATTGSPSTGAAACGTSCGGPLAVPCPPLSLEMFMSCMEEALRLRRGPRAYLVPSPPAKQVPAHSFRPAINPRSRALAAKSRPETASTFELLHRVAAQTAERLEMLRRKKEEAGLVGCTFQPQLNPNRSSAGGRPGGRTSNGSQHNSLDPSSFALAAAGIAAASVTIGENSPTGCGGSLEVHRRSLEQQLAELRLAADVALDMRSQLLQHAAEAAADGDAGQESAVEEAARFSMLEHQLRDMQALTEMTIDDFEEEQLRGVKLQQLKSGGGAGSNGGVDAVPPGGLQELATALGVTVASATSSVTRG